MVEKEIKVYPFGVHAVVGAQWEEKLRDAYREQEERHEVAPMEPVEGEGSQDQVVQCQDTGLEERDHPCPLPPDRGPPC